jgi:hypothetical protein
MECIPMFRKSSNQWDVREAVRRRIKHLPKFEGFYEHLEQVQKDTLDVILLPCENFRHEFGPKIRVETIGFSGHKKGVQEQVRRYLENSWMHHPSLTGYLASTLIDLTIALLTFPAGRLFDLRSRWIKFMLMAVAVWTYLMGNLPPFWISVVVLIFLIIVLPFFDQHVSRRQAFLRSLWGISCELDSGYYDGESLFTQLRKWEGKDYHVDSQMYSLLRLSSHGSKNDSDTI